MRTVLTFEAPAVARIVGVTATAPSLRPPYGLGEDLTEPCLYLIRDDGVYLGAHTETPIAEGETPRSLGWCVWAREADPARLDRDEVYEFGRRIFDGSDGIEALPLRMFTDALAAGRKYIRVTLTPKTVEVA